MIMLEEDEILDQQRSLIRFENELTDDNSGSESTSGLLQSSRDAFQQAAVNWGQARFRIRGLDSENAMTMINGVSMNKSYDGRPQGQLGRKRCHPKSGIYYRYRPSDYFWWNIRDSGNQYPRFHL
jgi:hypothetical protein